MSGPEKIEFPGAGVNINSARAEVAHQHGWRNIRILAAGVLSAALTAGVAMAAEVGKGAGAAVGGPIGYLTVAALIALAAAGTRFVLNQRKRNGIASREADDESPFHHQDDYGC